MWTAAAAAAVVIAVHRENDDTTGRKGERESVAIMKRYGLLSSSSRGDCFRCIDDDGDDGDGDAHHSTEHISVSIKKLDDITDKCLCPSPICLYLWLITGGVYLSICLIDRMPHLVHGIVLKHIAISTLSFPPFQCLFSLPACLHHLWYWGD